MVYNLGWRVVSTIALVWLFVRSPQHRWPAVLILLAETVVGAHIVLDPVIQESWFFYLPWKAIPVVACAIALFGLRIFDPIPLPRQTVIEQLQAAMLALDLKGRVITLNRQPRHKVAWLWLSAIVTDPARERECLEHVLAIDPSDIMAWNYRALGPTGRTAPSPPGRALIDSRVVIF